MNTSQIGVFIALSEYLNFSKTAESLYVSQSYVSKQISKLEEEWQVQLFHRDHHRVILTPAGEYMRNFFVRYPAGIGDRAKIRPVTELCGRAAASNRRVQPSGLPAGTGDHPRPSRGSPRCRDHHGLCHGGGADGLATGSQAGSDRHKSGFHHQLGTGGLSGDLPGQLLYQRQRGCPVYLRIFCWRFPCWSR